MASSLSTRDIRTTGKVKHEMINDLNDGEVTLGGHAININVSVSPSLASPTKRIWKAGNNEEKQETDEILNEQAPVRVARNDIRKKEGKQSRAQSTTDSSRRVANNTETKNKPVRESENGQEGNGAKDYIDPSKFKSTKEAGALEVDSGKLLGKSTSPETVKGVKTLPDPVDSGNLELSSVSTLPVSNTSFVSAGDFGDLAVEHGLYGMIRSFQESQVDAFLGMDTVVDQFNDFFQEPEPSLALEGPTLPINETTNTQVQQPKMEDTAQEPLNGSPESKDSFNSSHEEIVESPIEVFDAPGDRSTKVVVNKTVVDEITKTVVPVEQRGLLERQISSQMTKSELNAAVLTPTNKDHDEVRREEREDGKAEARERSIPRKKNRPGLPKPSLPGLGKSLSFWRKKKKKGQRDGIGNSGDKSRVVPDTNIKTKVKTPPKDARKVCGVVADCESSIDETNEGKEGSVGEPPSVVVVSHAPTDASTSLKRDENWIETPQQEKLATEESAKRTTSGKTESRRNAFKMPVTSIPTSSASEDCLSDLHRNYTTSNIDSSGSLKLASGLDETKTLPPPPPPTPTPFDELLSSSLPTSVVPDVKFSTGTAPKKTRRRKKKRRKKKRNPIDVSKRRRLPFEGEWANGYVQITGTQGEMPLGSTVDSNLIYEEESNRLKKEILRLESANAKLSDMAGFVEVVDTEAENPGASEKDGETSKVQPEVEGARRELKAEMEKAKAEELQKVRAEAALSLEEEKEESSKKAAAAMKLIREEYELKISAAKTLSKKSAQELRNAREREQNLEAQVQELTSKISAMNEEKESTLSEKSQIIAEKESNNAATKGGEQSSQATTEQTLEEQRESDEAAVKESELLQVKQEAETAHQELKVESEKAKAEEVKRIQGEAALALANALSEANQKAEEDIRIIKNQCQQKIADAEESSTKAAQELRAAQERERTLQQQVEELSSRSRTIKDEKGPNSVDSKNEEGDCESSEENSKFEKQVVFLTEKLQEIESLRLQEQQDQERKSLTLEEQMKTLEDELAKAKIEADELTTLRSGFSEIEILRDQNAKLKAEIEKLTSSMTAMAQSQNEGDLSGQEPMTDISSGPEKLSPELPVAELEPLKIQASQEGKATTAEENIGIISEQAQLKQRTSLLMKKESESRKLVESLKEQNKSLDEEVTGLRSVLESTKNREEKEDREPQQTVSALREQLEEVEASKLAVLSESNALQEQHARAEALEEQVGNLKLERQSMMEAEKDMKERIARLEKQAEATKSAELAAVELRSELESTQKMVEDIHQAIAVKGNRAEDDDPIGAEEMSRRVTKAAKRCTPNGNAAEPDERGLPVTWISQSRFEI